MHSDILPKVGWKMLVYALVGSRPSSFEVIPPEKGWLFRGQEIENSRKN